MTLREERALLAKAEYDSYDANAFPGSMQWRKNKLAKDALATFDRSYPEILAEIKAEKEAARKAKFDAMSKFAKTEANCPAGQGGKMERKINLSLYLGHYLPGEGATCFRSHNDVARWLESIGEIVAYHYDTGNSGLAITTSGIAVSTNGWVYRI